MLHLCQSIEEGLQVVALVFLLQAHDVLHLYLFLLGFVRASLVIHNTQTAVHYVDAVDAATNPEPGVLELECDGPFLLRSDDAEGRVAGIVTE